MDLDAVWGQKTPKTTPSPWTSSNTSIPRPTPLTTQMASTSNQPFCHSTPFEPTDRQTDWQTDRHMRLGLATGLYQQPLTLYCIATRLTIDNKKTSAIAEKPARRHVAGRSMHCLW